MIKVRKGNVKVKCSNGIEMMGDLECVVRAVARLLVSECDQSQEIAWSMVRKRCEDAVTEEEKITPKRSGLTKSAENIAEAIMEMANGSGISMSSSDEIGS